MNGDMFNVHRCVCQLNVLFQNVLSFRIWCFDMFLVLLAWSNLRGVPPHMDFDYLACTQDTIEHFQPIHPQVPTDAQKLGSIMPIFSLLAVTWLKWCIAPHIKSCAEAIIMILLTLLTWWRRTLNSSARFEIMCFCFNSTQYDHVLKLSVVRAQMFLCLVSHMETDSPVQGCWRRSVGGVGLSSHRPPFV